MPDTLREQIHSAIRDNLNNYASAAAADRVMDLVVERERVLRERIEAMRKDAPSWYHVVPADRANYGWDYALEKVLEMLGEC